ncbi:MAG: prepilin-type N-terminal cleavage/methylation domain-containing protein [Betaproteobacteria bacterium]|nr:MAG: prepilin-type N-terminal cleavage/methylation domain-containing protein [Betaproteobacteria bacterium]
MTMLREHGFTLIELMIALSIFAFLILIAGPMYADFMGNTQIRNGAENTLMGVRLAQTEALRGNTQAQFILDTSAAGGWQVMRLNDETGNFEAVQSYKWTDGASKTTVSAQPANATETTFNGLGRVIDNPDASARLQWIEVTNGNIATPRKLRVVIDSVTPTGIKLCDPDSGVASSDARFCPAS